MLGCCYNNDGTQICTASEAPRHGGSGHFLRDDDRVTHAGLRSFSEDTSNPNADICTTLCLLLVHPICFLLCSVYTNGIWCGSIIVSPNVCLLECKSSWWMPHFTDTRNAQSASLVTSHLDYFYLVHIYVCIYIHAMLHSYIIVYNTNTQLFITIDPHLFRVERSTSRY